MPTAFCLDFLGISYYTIFLLYLQVVSPENLTGISEGFYKQKNGNKKHTVSFCITRTVPAAHDAAVKAVPLSSIPSEPFLVTGKSATLVK